MARRVAAARLYTRILCGFGCSLVVFSISKVMRSGWLISTPVWPALPTNSLYTRLNRATDHLLRRHVNQRHVARRQRLPADRVAAVWRQRHDFAWRQRQVSVLGEQRRVRHQGDAGDDDLIVGVLDAQHP